MTAVGIIRTNYRKALFTGLAAIDSVRERSCAEKGLKPHSQRDSLPGADLSAKKHCIHVLPAAHATISGCVHVMRRSK